MNHNLLEYSAVVLPCYCPDERVSKHVKALLDAGFGKIIVIDDGSGEIYQKEFDKLPIDERVVLLQYTPNAGKGVALKTGYKYISEHCKDITTIITADSDGQHTVSDTVGLANALNTNPNNLWLGTRDFSLPHVPPKSRFGNKLTSFIFALLYGKKIQDTQTGLRAFNRKWLDKMINVLGERYEYEMNVLIECAKSDIDISQFTIQTVYENNNEGSHFNAIKDSYKIYKVILGGFFRFASTAIICFILDYSLYLIFNNTFKNIENFNSNFNFFFLQIMPHVLFATVLARIISGTVNYSLNKKYVFKNKSTIKTSASKYLLVFIMVMLLSAGLTSSLHIWLNLNENYVKIPVDIFLFMCNYYIQKNWVFKTK